MNEVILIIFISFAQKDTELYEYPSPSMEMCIKAVETAKTSRGVSAFCTPKSKVPTAPSVSDSPQLSL